MKHLYLLAGCVVILSGCATVPVNPELTQTVTDAKLIGVIAPKSVTERSGLGRNR